MISSSDVLDSSALEKWKKSLEGQWKWDNTAITLELNFKTFKENTSFLQRLFDVAEMQNHHPELFTSYTYSRIRLTTHDAGGITEKDITMALAINQLIH